MPITKLAENLIELTKTDKNNLNAVEGLYGASLALGADNKGQLTGRETLYHGTDSDTAKKILKEGILPVTKDTAHNTPLHKDFLNRAYTTRSLLEAASYAVDASSRLKNSPKVIKVSAPTWKMDNVEYSPHARDPQTGKFDVKKGEIFGHKVFVGGLSPEYVKGSDSYKGLTINEFLDYAKNNKKEFGKGLGKLALGLGGIGHSAYSLYKRNFDN